MILIGGNYGYIQLEYEHSTSLDENLESMYEKIAEEIGYPKEQEDEDMNESRRQHLIDRIAEMVNHGSSGK